MTDSEENDFLTTAAQSVFDGLKKAYKPDEAFVIMIMCLSLVIANSGPAEGKTLEQTRMDAVNAVTVAIPKVIASLTTR